MMKKKLIIISLLTKELIIHLLKYKSDIIIFIPIIHRFINKGISKTPFIYFVYSIIINLYSK